MKRALVLVEGQTEERFIKEVLAPAYHKMELYLDATLLVTKRVKSGPNYKGGVTNFAKFENDVARLLRNSGGALVTTLVDYYGLPPDFPGMSTRPTQGTPLQRAVHVEKAVHAHFQGTPALLPFLALHEFEAWLFSSTTELPQVMNDSNKQSAFAAIRDEFSNPEDINERYDHCPSRRISSLFPGYQKTVHGPLTARRIGLETIRQHCPHFGWWSEQLDSFARGSL